MASAPCGPSLAGVDQTTRPSAVAIRATAQRELHISVLAYTDPAGPRASSAKCATVSVAPGGGCHTNGSGHAQA